MCFCLARVIDNGLVVVFPIETSCVNKILIRLHDMDQNIVN